jgi:hypothetical protein
LWILQARVFSLWVSAVNTKICQKSSDEFISLGILHVDLPAPELRAQRPDWQGDQEALGWRLWILQARVFDCSCWGLGTLSSKSDQEKVDSVAVSVWSCFVSCPAGGAEESTAKHDQTLTATESTFSWSDLELNVQIGKETRKLLDIGLNLLLPLEQLPRSLVLNRASTVQLPLEHFTQLVPMLVVRLAALS